MYQVYSSAGLEYLLNPETIIAHMEDKSNYRVLENDDFRITEDGMKRELE